MKPSLAPIFASILLLSLALTASAQVSISDYLVLKKGEVHVNKGAESSVLKEKLSLPNGIQVETNGIVTLPGGVEKKLKENQRLTLDGFLVAGDGRLLRLEDHVTLRNGVVTIVKDGVGTPAAGAVKLKDGTQVLPRGMVVRPNGKRSRLIDGQMLRLSGAPLDGNDFVTFKNGKVMIQKNGSILELSAKRTLMMNDGSKVFGDGTIHKSDGTRITLQDGQRYNLPGAR